MINIKSPHEIECMRKSGAILRDCLLFLGERVKPGVSTKRLDEFAYDYIKRHDSTPSFLGYGGFPGTICASIDEVVVHGFPSDRRLKEGEIIGVDCDSCSRVGKRTPQEPSSSVKSVKKRNASWTPRERVSSRA